MHTAKYLVPGLPSEKGLLLRGALASRHLEILQLLALMSLLVSMLLRVLALE